MQTVEEILCKDLPEPFCKFLKYAKELEYDEKPDYKRLRHEFRVLFMDKYVPTSPNTPFKYDWQMVPATSLKLEKKYSKNKKVAQQEHPNVSANESLSINHNGGKILSAVRSGDKNDIGPLPPNDLVGSPAQQAEEQKVINNK